MEEQDLFVKYENEVFNFNSTFIHMVILTALNEQPLQIYLLTDLVDKIRNCPLGVNTHSVTGTLRGLKRNGLIKHGQKLQNGKILYEITDQGRKQIKYMEFCMNFAKTFI